MKARFGMCWLVAVALLLLPLTQTGCGDEATNEPLGVSNVTPVGSVGGLIVDAVTLKGIKDVDVQVLAGGSVYKAANKTDATGQFSVDKVPPGGLIVMISPLSSGKYMPVNIVANMPNAAGEFPLANATLSVGPVGLIPKATATEAFRVQILTADGAPANNVTATLSASVKYVDYKSGTAQAKGTTMVEAKTGGSGVAKFTGMPDFSALLGLVGNGISDTVRVKVMPYDKNADGVFEFLGKETIYNVTQLKNHVPTIILNNDKAPTALKIEASSISALTGTKGPRQLGSTSGPLYVAFNWPLDSTLTKISLYDEFGNIPPNLPTVNISGNLLTVNFKGLKAGAEYNITIKAYATVGKELLSGTFGAPFFTPPTSSSAKVTASLSRKSTDTTHPNYTTIVVTFSEPVGTGTPGQSLSGSNAVVYFGYDLDGNGKTGDSPSERGYTSSQTTLTINEKAPPGKAGLSGFATRWQFVLPNTSLGGAVAAGTPVDLSFSRISLKVERASGELVADMTNLTVPAS